MSSHITVERLSAYLDAELDDREAGLLESHLGACEVCQRHLAGLQRVVTGLRHLERVRPPAVLDQSVERRVSLERVPRGLVERLEAQLSRRPRIEPGVALGFALVFALAAFIFLFAQAIDQPQSTIVVPAPMVEAGEEGSVVEAGGRLFLRLEGGWHEMGLEGGISRVILATSTEAESLRRELPWLEELLEGAASVRLRHQGETVLLEVEEPEAP